MPHRKGKTTHTSRRHDSEILFSGTKRLPEDVSRSSGSAGVYPGYRTSLVIIHIVSAGFRQMMFPFRAYVIHRFLKIPGRSRHLLRHTGSNVFVCPHTHSLPGDHDLWEPSVLSFHHTHDPGMQRYYPNVLASLSPSQ